MTSHPQSNGPVIDPLNALVRAETDGVLAIITGIEGPSYRPMGAWMAFLPDSRRVGTLSSGCIESDLALHAARALETGRPVPVRYGRGSPFLDISLPCGGGLDIVLLPRPDLRVLAELAREHVARRVAVLNVDLHKGALSLQTTGDTGMNAGRFLVRCLPEIDFQVFGKGPEAHTFAALAKSVGYGVQLLSPDAETLENARNSGCRTVHLTGPEFPETLAVDARSAIVLFFHDHEWEPEILRTALATSAFYIGAQGSQRARDQRHLELTSMGVTAADLARLCGPIGLVPSARDARTLAVSVLAEVLAAAATAA